MAEFLMRPFLPTPRQTNLLLLLGFAALGLAIYLRHAVLDADFLAIVCLPDKTRATCFARSLLAEFSGLQVFGGVALVFAAIHFWRPELRLFAVAMIGAIFGLLLGNVPVSAFAAAVLVISFARPQRANTQAQTPQAPPQSTMPASSRKTH
jgi:hypothetical protein